MFTHASSNRVFLLSPASCSGRRAEILLREQAAFDLAVRLRTPEGATLGEAFSFLSGLYFRGKLAYATCFGSTVAGVSKALVITAGSGLLAPESAVTIDSLRTFASVPIDVSEPRYFEPLQRDAEQLAERLNRECRVVLLGSIATAKYRDVLAKTLGDRLDFPTEFIGRGDMSRGGLLLRCVDAGCELQYAPLTGAIFRGARPAKLAPRMKLGGGTNKEKKLAEIATENPPPPSSGLANGAGNQPS